MEIVLFCLRLAFQRIELCVDLLYEIFSMHSTSFTLYSRISFNWISTGAEHSICAINSLRQGVHWSGNSQGNLFLLQCQGKVREFYKMVRVIRKFQKSGNFKNHAWFISRKLNNRYEAISLIVLE